MLRIFRNHEYNQIADRVLIFALVILANRISNWFTLGIAIYGVAAATSKKAGKALVVFMLLSLLPMINPMIMPRYGQYSIIARITSLLMSAALISSGCIRNGKHQLPLLTLYLYLFVSFFSSAFGYYPLISYLKILNFSFFILGIYYGTKNIHQNPEDLREIRISMLALIILLVYGSLMTIPFPSVAYFTSVRSALISGDTLGARNILSGDGTKLFSGITVHSQFLGPMAASCFGWLLCDMWIAERKISKLHIALLAPIPIIAFMTRSRLAFLVLIAAVLGNALYCIPKVKVPQKLKRAFTSMMTAGLVFMLVGGVYAEVRSSTISRWIRKTETLSEDTRSLGDAISSSRQGLIDESIKDFKKNIFIGKGFQVAEGMRTGGKGMVSLFSAPVEKGVLPIMILGEAGIAGAMAFIVFLIAFFCYCNKKKYIATSVLFMVFLSTNIAEATFFSPAGAGGVMWVFMLAGGFAIDMTSVVAPAGVFIRQVAPAGPGWIPRRRRRPEPQGEDKSDMQEVRK